MRRFVFVFTIIFLTFGGALQLEAQMTFSGFLDSTISTQAGAGDAPGFSCGVEEFANIRFQSRLRDRGTFSGAVNLFAAAGSYAHNAALMAQAAEMAGIPAGVSPTPYIVGEHYVAGFEVERLQFRLNFEHVDLEGGLFRLPFGYGQVWGSSDFLNPRNPLKPDARPRAVLGTALSWYPNEELKLQGFSSSPSNPFIRDGGGWLTGISTDKHWEKASLQGLYAYQLPIDGSEHAVVNSSKYGVHRAGLSVKADVEIGLYIDALYTYNHEARTGHEGLSFSAGADYSFFGGDLIVLAEYLYNGSSSSTAIHHGGDFSNEHYLYTGFTYSFSAFTNATAALISGLSDISFTPLISVNHDLFQGATLTVTAQVPIDRDLFSGDGNRGELGPLPPMPSGLEEFSIGRYFDLTVKLRVRF